MPPTADPAHLHARVHTHARTTNTILHTCLCTHTHTCHTHSQTCTLTVHTHAQTCTHKPALAHAYTHPHMPHTKLHTHSVHTRTHAHTNLHSHAPVDTSTQVHMPTGMAAVPGPVTPVCTRMHTHTCWHGRGTWHAEGSPRQQLPGPSGVAASSSPELAPPLATLTPHCHQGALVACCGSQVAPAPSPKPA